MVFAQHLCLLHQSFLLPKPNLPFSFHNRTNLHTSSSSSSSNMNNANNSFSMSFFYGSHNYYGGEEQEARLIYEPKTCASAMDDDDDDDVNQVTCNEGQAEVFDFEFWPVEHPSEPLDEDHPLKCPMPDSSVINIDMNLQGRGAGRVSESKNCKSATSRKRAEVCSSPARVAVPVGAMRKRHHTLTHGNGGERIMSPMRRMPRPQPRALPVQSITVFQMLQQQHKS